MRSAKLLVKGVHLRRSLAGRWVGKIAGHRVTLRPWTGTYKNKSLRWEVYLNHTAEPLGRAATIHGAIVIAQLELEKQP